MAPSSTIGAVIPLCLSAPTKVVVFQWPCGTLAMQRVPRCERPRSRAILVDAPVSSMNTRRAGSRSGCAARQACLALTTSARSCSLACAVFFECLGMAIETSPDRALRKPLTVLPCQVLGDLGQRDVHLGRY